MINAQQKQRLQRISRLHPDPQVAILQKLLDMEEVFDSVKDKKFYKGEKGNDGRDGRAGKDAVIEERHIKEVTKRVLASIKVPKDGKDGPKGKDAEVDYNLIVQRVLEQIEPPKNGKDGSPDMAEDIRNKLELLSGDERLDAKHIKGLDILKLKELDEIIRIVKNGMFNPTMGPSFADIQLLKDRLTSLETGGSGLTKLTTSSTVDGSNTVFVFSKAPTYLTVDGVWYDNNGGAITWTGTTTVTLSSPPISSIWGFK